MTSLNFFLLTTILIITLNLSLAVDYTLIEKTVGRDVVEAVVDKVRNIFSEDDHEFFRRVAYVETRDGESNLTFAPDYYGGIWDVRKTKFDDSKHSSLSKYHQDIETQFKIKWADVTWNDLLKPLYSGLAARLFIESIGQPIPQTLKEQGKYWNDHYNDRDSENDQTFINRTEELINSTVVCSGKMDLVIVLDGSSSVNLNNPDNFDICRQFVIDLIGTYSMENVRSGFVVYSSEAYPIFDLNHKLSFDQIKEKILAIRYPDEQTDTNSAIMAAFQMFLSASPRPGVPQVFTIFTDGKSKPQGVTAINFLNKKGISSYSIGITDQIDMVELTTLAYNISRNVFTLNNFELLTEFFKRLNTETCKLTQKPEMDTPVQDSVNQNEKRFYSFTIPTEGMTISIDNEEGETTGYYSYDEPNPTSAIHDGVLFWAGTFIEPRDNGENLDQDFMAVEVNQTIYVSIEGLESVNKYTLEAISGYAVGSSTTGSPTSEDPTTEKGSVPTNKPTESTTESFAHHIEGTSVVVFTSILFVSLHHLFY